MELIVTGWDRMGSFKQEVRPTETYRYSIFEIKVQCRGSCDIQP